MASRREFLHLSGYALGAAVLAACAPSSPTHSDVEGINTRMPDGPAVPPEPTKTPLVIDSQFPTDRFPFSQKIIDFNLVPKVLPKDQFSADRMQEGLNYLGRLEALFEANPINRPKTLKDVFAISDFSYPCNLRPEFTAQDVIGEMRKDFESGNVVLYGQGQENVDYLMATAVSPYLDTNGQWKVQGIIFANIDFLYLEPQNEDYNTSYTNYTDLQVALKVVHEYVHFKQFEAILNLVLRDNANIIEESQNGQELITVLINAKLDSLKTSMNTDSRIDRKEVPGPISFNEMQSNFVSQMMLSELNKLNNARMPGTEDDMYSEPENSLYQVFQRAIINDQNPFDSQWLKFYLNW